MGKYYLGNQSGTQVNFSLTDSSGVVNDLNLTGLFLEKTGTAVNSLLLQGHDKDYFRNAGNLTGSILIEYTGLAPNALLLNSRPDTYYLNATNLTGVFTGSVSGLSTDAEQLNGQSGSYYLNLANHTGVANFTGRFTGDFIGTLSGTIAHTDYVYFHTGVTQPNDVARIQWNDAQASLSAGLLNNVSTNLGQDLVAYVRNDETGIISKGQAVYLFGAQGDKATVKLASNLSDTTSSKTLGIAMHNIAAGQLGYVKSVGVVDGLTLGAYNAGDILWLGTAPGSLTVTKPQAPLHMALLTELIMEMANST
jgi:hypothetical protein